MKLICDVCEESPADLICCADEAALCCRCDARIHEANKIAGKHERLKLVSANSATCIPTCDICQEKNGCYFCLEDRALLCRGCDFLIHTTNNIVSKHKRFVVMGTQVELYPFQTNVGKNIEKASSNHELEVTQPHKRIKKDSSTSSDSSKRQSCGNGIHEMVSSETMLPNLSNSGSTNEEDANENMTSNNILYSSSEDIIRKENDLHDINQGISIHALAPKPSNQQCDSGITFSDKQEKIPKANATITSRNTICEYLTEVIPGWQVDDLLASPQDSTRPNPHTYASYLKSFGAIEGVGVNEDLAKVPEINSHAQPFKLSMKEMKMMDLSQVHPWSPQFLNMAYVEQYRDCEVPIRDCEDLQLYCNNPNDLEVPSDCSGVIEVEGLVPCNYNNSHVPFNGPYVEDHYNGSHCPSLKGYHAQLPQHSDWPNYI